MNHHYAAGFFDGEGCVGVTYIRQGNGIPYYIVSVKIANTVRSVLEEFKEQWGGSIFRLAGGRKGNRKPAWYWRVAAQKAKRFILDVRPYLRIKGPISDLGIKLIDIQNFTGKHFNEKEKAYQSALRQQIWNDMRKLNQRGLIPWEGPDVPKVARVKSYSGGVSRTHCFNGHPWKPANLTTYKDKKGKEHYRCHLCVKEQGKDYQRRVRAARRDKAMMDDFRPNTLRQPTPEAALGAVGAS